MEADKTLEESLDALFEDLTKAIKDVIDQPDSKVKVQRWFPGVVEEVVEETCEKSLKDVRQRLLKEASTNLERKATLQTHATVARTYEEIVGEKPGETGGTGTLTDSATSGNGGASALLSQAVKKQTKERPRRRQRHKTLSTPVIGGGLFGEVEARSGRDGNPGQSRVSDYSKKQKDLSFSLNSSGVPAEISIKGEVFQIRISESTWKDLQNGIEGQTKSSRGVAISGIEITARDDAPVVQRLQGFVRTGALSRIHEEEESVISEEVNEQ